MSVDIVTLPEAVTLKDFGFYYMYIFEKGFQSSVEIIRSF